jgi:uncharacterized membrane protein
MVDLARGAALVAMAIYHFAWDLSFLRLIETEVATDPVWRWAARLIAGCFLFLVGVSLVLGHGSGVRWRSFLKRLATIAAAAGAITLATVFAFPDSYIFFGILHCIALSSVLALPFLRAPIVVVLATALVVLAAPLVLRSAVFDAPFLAWLGLGARSPVTNDYVPIFPWFAMVLAGLGAARLVWPKVSGSDVARWRARGPLGRGLAFAGRHSLLVYLVHQPLLLAALYPASQLVGPNPRAEAAPFIRTCEEQCRALRRSADLCGRTCRCTVERLKQDDLWTRVLRGTVTAEEERRAGALARACVGEER